MIGYLISFIIGGSFGIFILALFIGGSGQNKK